MVSGLKRLWHSEQDLRGAASLLVITMLLSNILGFLRDLILANAIPLHILDTYYAAFRIPDFLFNLFILGAISSAFIPIFLDIKTKENDKAAWELSNNLITTSLIFLGILCVGLYIFMPNLLHFFVPGFSTTDTLQAESGYIISSYAMTVKLARILLFSPIFFAISYVFGGMLNANKRFFSYALAPLVYNASIIVGGLLAPGFTVTIVAWMVVVGALLHALVQLPALRKLGYKYHFVLNLKDASLRRIIRLMIPRSLSLGMSQIILLAFTRIGSLLPAGAISIYNLTNNFQTTPTAIFAASIGTAVFPMLGAAVSEKDNEKYKSLLTHALKGMFFFMIPSMILLWILRAHIIRLYLALNHQTWEDTIRAINTFSWFILALASQGFNLIMIRAFYAHQDTKRPMYVSLFSGAVAVILAWILANRIGDVWALSMAFALAAILESLILFTLFQSTYRKQLNLRSLLDTITMTLLISLASGLVARVTLSIVSDGVFVGTPGLGTTRIIPLFINLLSAALTGGLTYLAISLLLKREELQWITPKRAVKNIPLPSSEDTAQNEGLA
ncbi:MAG TPA: murein biosynthesis integral membrane protein MurJ [Patescibacteria group bacterium]